MEQESRDSTTRHRRREENDADLVRLAREVMGLIDTAPCEMPPVQPSYTAPDNDAG